MVSWASFCRLVPDLGPLWEGFCVNVQDVAAMLPSNALKYAITALKWNSNFPAAIQNHMCCAMYPTMANAS